MSTGLEIKNKLCVICGLGFRPYKTTERVCSYSCSVKLSDQKADEKKAKEKETEKKASELKGALTYFFNRYIRLRDRGKSCITCPDNLGYNIALYDAGHCYGVGAYPELQYLETNVHGQCKGCNQDEGGKHSEYLENITGAITLDQLDKLHRLKNQPRKYTAYEIQALTLKYRNLCKTLDIEI